MNPQNYRVNSRAGGQCPLPPPPPLFCIGKRKNGNKGKSRKDLKAETIKRRSPRLKCYYFSDSRVPRIQKFFQHSLAPSL